MTTDQGTPTERDEFLSQLVEDWETEAVKTGKEGVKSAQIRYMFRNGATTGEISRIMKIRYQHVYNVLKQSNLK